MLASPLRTYILDSLGSSLSASASFKGASKFWSLSEIFFALYLDIFLSILCLDSQSLLIQIVHKLRPSDISVVAAIGDSITVDIYDIFRMPTGQAAFGAEADTPFQLFNEYRGVSWSGGGIESFDTVKTMPSMFPSDVCSSSSSDMLKHFNKNIIGGATGTGGPATPQAGMLFPLLSQFSYAQRSTSL